MSVSNIKPEDNFLIPSPLYRMIGEPTKLTSWHARPGILKGTSSKLLFSVIDDSKTVTGTMSKSTCA